jgi:hypothetical protein
MENGIAGIDHVIVGVRDLEAARGAWMRLGFAVSPRGRHIGQGTANYCIMFGRDYLELLGFVEPDEFGHRLDAFLARREGAMSVAFAPIACAGAASASLAALGLHPSPPRALGRELELPEGSVVPRFSLVTVAPEETPALDCFVCGHLTPELMRRPSWLAHPNGVTGIAAVHLLVADPAPLATAYKRLFATDETVGGIAVDTGRNLLSFTTPRRFQADHPGIAVPVDFPLPGIVALELAVESEERTAAYLSLIGIPFVELPSGRLAIPAQEANGIVLMFVEK